MVGLLGLFLLWVMDLVGDQTQLPGACCLMKGEAARLFSQAGTHSAGPVGLTRSFGFSGPPAD